MGQKVCFGKKDYRKKGLSDEEYPGTKITLTYIFHLHKQAYHALGEVSFWCQVMLLHHRIDWMNLNQEKFNLKNCR